MRSEKFIFLSHCLLNQLTRAGDSFTPGVPQKIMEALGECSSSQIYQLPCPEYLFAGKRSKKTQDEWEKMEGFVDFLSSLAGKTEEVIEEIVKDKDLLVIAIARSPCCSAHQVYRGQQLIEGRGLWVAELEKRFKFTIIEFDFNKVDDSACRIKQFLKLKSW